MKREEYAITLMDRTHVAVNWASPVMESTAVVCFCRRIFTSLLLKQQFEQCYLMLLADIDECFEGSDECDSHADCTNTIGNYECTCTIGYTGNGITCGQLQNSATALKL